MWNVDGCNSGVLYLVRVIVDRCGARVGDWSCALLAVGAVYGLVSGLLLFDVVTDPFLVCMCYFVGENGLRCQRTTKDPAVSARVTSCLSHQRKLRW